MTTKVHTFRSRYKANNIDLDGNYDQLEEAEANMSGDEMDDGYGNKIHVVAELPHAMVGGEPRGTDVVNR